jgi:hypothetical protein
MDLPPISANLPRPARDWRPYAAAVGVLLAAASVWIAALSVDARRAVSPRTLVIEAATAPAPVTSPGAAVRPRAAIVPQPTASQQRADLSLFQRRDRAHVPASWVAGFYPVYETAAKTFGVNWLLLASVHKQETAFSTDPSTYFGLNFAHCCGGPMQFNVTNGPVTTWALVRDSYRYGARPAAYTHATPTHPSIYDDFDSMMAAARLLMADGGGVRLDAAAWNAAYSYYGHDPTGVAYADQVLARAITWSQKGFCINCALDQPMVDAVHGAYGAPVLAALTGAAPKAKGQAKAGARKHPAASTAGN